MEKVEKTTRNNWTIQKENENEMGFFNETKEYKIIKKVNSNDTHFFQFEYFVASDQNPKTIQYIKC